MSPVIWYVHPYAGGPGIGRYGRPYELGKEWLRQGVRPLVVTASFQHLQDKPGTHASEVDVRGVPYAFLKVPAYRTNGIDRLFNMAAFTAQLVRQAARLAQRHGKPDLVIGSSPHPYAFLGTHAVARRFGARSVFEVRDLWPLSLVELAGVPPTHPLVRFTGWLERYAYRRADAVVSLLPCTRDYMAAKGLDEDRWLYIPNGVEPPGAAQADSTQPCLLRARQWQAEGRTIVVYTGAMGAPNYVGSLVGAMEVLRQRGDDRVRAVIVGRGEESDAISLFVKEKGLQERVALFGQIPKADIHALLAEADVGYISLRPEPLFRFGVSPNKLFDYMMASLPVLFAVEAGNDPVEEAGCGYSVPPGDRHSIADALARFASSTPDERRQMGQRGYRYVRMHHSYERLAAEYLLTLEMPRVEERNETRRHRGYRVHRT